MNGPLIAVAAVVTLGVMYVLVPLAAHTFQRYRNRKVLQCPQTQGLAEVDIDARRAALSSLFSRPILRIKACSLWPARKGCDQDCTKSA